MALQMIEVRGEYPSTKLIKRKILWHLAHNGPVVDRQSGRASAKMLEVLGNPFGLGQLGQFMKDLEEDGYITREKRGKRTYGIALAISTERLAADMVYRDDPWPKPGEEPEPAPEPPAAELDEPEPEPDPGLRMVPPLESDGQSWAEVVELPEVESFTDPLRCFGHAIALIAHGMALTRPLTQHDATYDRVLRRLGEQQEESQRLRREVEGQRKRAELAEDLAKARKHEVEGLRSTMQALQANLDKLAKGSLDEAGYARYRQLERLQSSRPEPASAGR